MRKVMQNQIIMFQIVLMCFVQYVVELVRPVDQLAPESHSYSSDTWYEQLAEEMVQDE